MKPSTKIVDSPGSPLSEFRNFILAVFKKKVFLFSLLMGMVELLIHLVIPEFSLPKVYPIGIVFVGFVLSAFQVYRELSLEYQKAKYPYPIEKARESELSISFVKGNEYRYAISDPFAGQNHLITRMQKTRGVKSRFDERGVFIVNGRVYYLMGKGNLEINIQVQNSGALPLDVLSLEVDNDLDLSHLRLVNEGTFLHGDKLRFPLHLDIGELVILQTRYTVSINRGSHEALFAADFRALPRSFSHEISIDTIDAEMNRQTYTSEIRTQSSPLIDLYVKQWREYDQEEFLVLSGYRQEGDGG